jgi:hypothetical protein
MNKNFNYLQRQEYDKYHKYFSRFSKKDIRKFYDNLVEIKLPITVAKKEAFFDVAREKGFHVESSSEPVVDFHTAIQNAIFPELL